MNHTPRTDRCYMVEELRETSEQLETELAEALETSAIRSRIVNKQTLELADARAEIERLKQELRCNSTIVSPAVLALNDATAELVRKDKLIEQMWNVLKHVRQCSCSHMQRTTHDMIDAALSAAERLTHENPNK